MTTQKPEKKETTMNNFTTLQTNISVPKAKVGSTYKYRNVEDITTAMKKVIKELNLPILSIEKEVYVDEKTRCINVTLVDTSLSKDDIDRTISTEKFYTLTECAKSSSTGKGIMSEPQ
jgi:hypothetical protein